MKGIIAADEYEPFNDCKNLAPALECSHNGALQINNCDDQTKLYRNRHHFHPQHFGWKLKCRERLRNESIPITSRPFTLWSISASMTELETKLVRDQHDDEINL
jgi:hypothetical protein